VGWLQRQLGWRSTAATCVTGVYKGGSPQRSQGSEEKDRLLFSQFVHLADEGNTDGCTKGNCVACVKQKTNLIA